MLSDDPFLRYTVNAFYHFTDIRNVPLIIESGGLLSMIELRKRGIKVPAPGGNEWSQEADGKAGLDHYVHLCFHRNHPMEFVAREEKRIEQSIFLEIHRDILLVEGVRYSPGVSNKAGMSLHTLEEARGLIDFEVLYTRTDWHVPEIQSRLQSAQKAELLVPKHIPLRYIMNFPNG